MKRPLSFIIALAMLTACGTPERQLKERAAELCRYIPDHALLTQSREYMTEDFYSALDTIFNHLPDYEEVDHEWLYYFVTGNGGTIADYEVQNVEKTDPAHAVATILVRQKWEDGSFDETSDIEEHRLYMERVDGKWLMSDFDEHKAACIRYIAISRRDQAIREAMSAYLVSEIAPNYLQGELCVPTIMIVAEDSNRVWCDCWIDWFNLSGDTLKSVSGGNHSGCMTLAEQDNTWRVTAFEQTEDGARNIASAKRIFGSHYDIYNNMHSNEAVREACRRLQLRNYVSRHRLNVRYYQDFGWSAVEL
ncbi:MAG: membrane lipoprotein lipid attachment site-containing protein [Paludibacteraceae bacterium]|nr:membrane lipoprotein lipid attachment site-containing protein [Paludibacteraceae bacterium]